MFVKDSRLPKDMDQTEQTRVFVKQTGNKTKQTRANKTAPDTVVINFRARVCMFVFS